MNMKYSTRGAIILLLIVFSFFSLCGLCPAYGEKPDPAITLHRFALIIGSNNGGEGRTILRYATKDALSFAKVMKDMGAVYNDNVILLLDPAKDDIVPAFREMQNKISSYKGAPGRKEFVVYYSGHSDEEGLLLFGQKLPYKDFRDEISKIKAEVRVAILDSCSSGAFTRAKGIIKQPPFLVDSSSEMEGYAFLTSSAEDEAAQESDSIMASYFTHFLVSGLRGAADHSCDGLVTLNEAYSYAFSETLARTETTQHGPQHPKYDIQLTGTGDLVLTDLRETSASLLLADEMEGRLYIRDTSGNLVVEIRKVRGYTVELGLEPGRYEITMDQDGNLSKGSVRLIENDRKLLLSTDLKKINEDNTVPRGDDIIADEEPEDYPGEKRILPFHNSLLPSFSQPGYLDPNYTYACSVNLLIGTAANINGIQVSSIGNFVHYNMYGMQGAGIFNYVGGYMSGFQGSGIGNITEGEVLGTQASGIFNYAGRNVKYMQASGLLNITSGTLNGIQGAGITNYASSVNGVQGAGLLNISGDTNGAQFSGLINFANNLNGFQGGPINIAGDVSGMQFGVINYANNYKHGFPLGLISIEKNGGISLDFWYNESGYTNTGLRLGTRFMYTLITAAMVLESDPVLWSYGLGWGFQFPFSIFSLDTDISFNAIYKGEEAWESFDGNINLLPRVRGLVGINIGKRIKIYGGYTCNLYIPGLYNDFNPDDCQELDIPYIDDSVFIKAEVSGGVSLHLF